MADINLFLKQNKRDCSRGAPMGASGYVQPDCPFIGLRCQRLRMVDHAYGPDGTYWGAGHKKLGYMYVIFNNNNAEYKMGMGLLKYYRATTRKIAIQLFYAESAYHRNFTFAKRN